MTTKIGGFTVPAGEAAEMPVKEGKRMLRKMLLGAGIVVLLGCIGSAWAREGLLGNARSLFQPIPPYPAGPPGAHLRHNRGAPHI